MIGKNQKDLTISENGCDDQENDVSSYLDKLNDEVKSLRKDQGIEKLGLGQTLEEANTDIKILQSKIDVLQSKIKSQLHHNMHSSSHVTKILEKELDKVH